MHFEQDSPTYERKKKKSKECNAKGATEMEEEELE